MIRYIYNRQHNPPAPFVYVTLRNVEDSTRAEQIPALIDCGADRSVIPIAMAQALGLRRVDELPFAGLDGKEVRLVTSHVGIRVHELKEVVVEAATSAGETHVLLGRDFLNHHLVILNGPELALEIGMS